MLSNIKLYILIQFLYFFKVALFHPLISSSHFSILVQTHTHSYNKVMRRNHSCNMRFFLNTRAPTFSRHIISLHLNNLKCIYLLSDFVNIFHTSNSSIYLFCKLDSQKNNSQKIRARPISIIIHWNNLNYKHFIFKIKHFCRSLSNWCSQKSSDLGK